MPVIVEVDGWEGTLRPRSLPEEQLEIDEAVPVALMHYDARDLRPCWHQKVSVSCAACALGEAPCQRVIHTNELALHDSSAKEKSEVDDATANALAATLKIVAHLMEDVRTAHSALLPTRTSC